MVHAIGDRANRELVAIFETLKKAVHNPGNCARSSPTASNTCR
jgi:predicted amidohydrolase YtcJ